MSSLAIANDQEVAFSVAFQTAGGKPASIDGKPTWSLSEPAKAALVPATNADGSEDPLSIVVVPADGATGTVQVICNADADLGAGVRPVGASFDLELTSPEAAAATITPGTPAPKRTVTATP